VRSSVKIPRRAGVPSNLLERTCLDRFQSETSPHERFCPRIPHRWALWISPGCACTSSENAVRNHRYEIQSSHFGGRQSTPAFGRGESYKPTCPPHQLQINKEFGFHDLFAPVDLRRGKRSMEEKSNFDFDLRANLFTQERR
jgi:hypothetical protein